MRLSILDRANTVDGATDAEALRRVVARAVVAEQLGFHRFLVAEHHAVPGIAGSAPGILAAAVGQATSTIRIGTAGIMVPAHTPLVVAEQAAVLEALFPGRVDIGLGSSTGFTGAVRKALRQDRIQHSAYLSEVDEVLGYLRGGEDVTMRPAVGPAPKVYLLTGGSKETVEAAADRGIDVIVGGPESGNLDGAIISRTVAVARTRDEARDLVLPEVWAQVMARTTGSFAPLKPADGLDESTLTAQQRQRIGDGLSRTVHGTVEEVAGALRGLRARTGVSEILVSGGSPDVEGQRRSDELLSGIEL